MNIGLGVLAVAIGGFIAGSGVWPIKLMRKYQFEHWWFVSMFTGLLVLPWVIGISSCPNLVAALRSVPRGAIVEANLWAVAWGVANILCGLCYVRIGIALTSAILCGWGVCFGAGMPLLLKGSGVFRNAPSILSSAGLTIVAGALVALLGVILAGSAGSRRDQAREHHQPQASGFGTSLLLAFIAGLLSCGLTLCFVYGQGPIVAALKANGAGDLAATIVVWTVVLGGGALVSVGYGAWLLTKGKSWAVLWRNPGEFGLALVIGLNMIASVAFLGKGMLLMGSLGGSVGAGLRQIAWMLGGQSVGYLAGEWRGVSGRPRTNILLAVGLLCLAAGIMACGNLFTQPHKPSP